MSTARAAPRDEGDIAEEVAFLARPSAWPHHPPAVEVVETHLSWVFLAGGEVYKLKKPVRFDLQDLRSAAARHRSCEVETALNRRLAPEVYLGTVPLGRDPAGGLVVGRGGAPVDWMVRMRRLPAERFLDRAIRDRSLEPAALQAAAAAIARFHLGQRPAIREAGAYRRHLSRLVEDAASRISSCELAPPGEPERLRAGLLGWIESHGELLAQRVSAGRIVEGHGDLRPEHVCLADPPAIIDCLEFDPRLRTLDAVDELAFLALECERLGSPEIGPALLQVWSERAREPVDPELVTFHQASRALVRASIPAMRLEALRSADVADAGTAGLLHRRLEDHLRLAAHRLGLLGRTA